MGGKNYKKLMEVDIEERKELLEKPRPKMADFKMRKEDFVPRPMRPDEELCTKRSVDPLAVVKDLLVMGRRQTAMKWCISMKEVLRIYCDVYKRIENSYLRKSKEGGATHFKEYSLATCKVKGCDAIVPAGWKCTKHLYNHYQPKPKYNSGKISTYKSGQVSRVKAIHNKEKKAIQKAMAKECTVPQHIYADVMKYIIKTCIEGYQVNAARYYADMDGDIVDMAVKGHFMSTRAIKAVLVQVGTEISQVLRGLETMHKMRFMEEASKWAVVYEDFVKEAKRKKIA